MQSNFEKINELKRIVKDGLNTHFTCKVVDNGIKVADCKISIVMTSSNRSEQVYTTLKTIERQNILCHVVIVDDSDSDKITGDALAVFKNMHFELIEIVKEVKNWINPCINYNIGFEYIKCANVIIQNGEVAHVGDVCEHLLQNVKDDKYYVFDVISMRDFNDNKLVTKIIKDKKQITHEDLYTHFLFNTWYQHAVISNRKYHFLAGLTYNTFKKINSFSYEYYSQPGYDDDDFVLKIQSRSIDIVCVDNRIHKLLGVHLFHTSHHWVNVKQDFNSDLFIKKRNIYQETGNYSEA